ncbi:unnamed protein product, partial [Mesorhabditis spiculigera]
MLPRFFHSNSRFLVGVLCGLLLGFVTRSILDTPSFGGTGEFSELTSFPEFKDNGSVKAKAATGNGNQTGPEAITDVLFKSVKILCWVMTHPLQKNVEKVKAINSTWAQRCNKVVFFSTFGNLSVETWDLEFQEGRNTLWDKTKRVLIYLNEEYGSQYDWYFKADDDTYAVMENMRFMLSAYDPGIPRYLGCQMMVNGIYYQSGGPGYILSHAAVSKFAHHYIDDLRCPANPDGFEDYNLGRCMNALNISSTDSRDIEGRLRFLPLSPLSLFMDEIPGWLEERLPYKYHHKTDCCSDIAISFHYIDPKAMYLLDFLIYRLRVFGRNDGYMVSTHGSRQQLLDRIRLESRSKSLEGT